MHSNIFVNVMHFSLRFLSLSPADRTVYSILRIQKKNSFGQLIPILKVVSLKMNWNNFWQWPKTNKLIIGASENQNFLFITHYVADEPIDTFSDLNEKLWDNPEQYNVCFNVKWNMARFGAYFLPHSVRIGKGIQNGGNELFKCVSL